MASLRGKRDLFAKRLRSGQHASTSPTIRADLTAHAAPGGSADQV